MNKILLIIASRNSKPSMFFLNMSCTLLLIGLICLVAQVNEFITVTVFVFSLLFTSLYCFYDWGGK